MKILKRYGILLILLAIEGLYFPLNATMEGGILVKITLDSNIPLLPDWVILYIFCFPLWIGAYAWFGAKVDERLFWELWVSSLITYSVGIVIFILIPTYVERPLIIGQGWTVDVLRYVYSHDRTYNAFPSAHVYITTTIALFYARWNPKFRLPGIIMLVLITLSTLFTKQHSILDPIGGLALALAGYWLGLKYINYRFSNPKRTLAPRRKTV